MKKLKKILFLSLLITVSVVVLAGCACGSYNQKSTYAWVSAFSNERNSNYFVINEDCYLTDCPKGGDVVYFQTKSDIKALYSNLTKDRQKGSDFQFNLNKDDVKIDITHTYTDRIEYFTIFRDNHDKWNTYTITNGSFCLANSESRLYFPPVFLKTPKILFEGIKRHSARIAQNTPLELAEDVTREDIIKAYQATKQFSVEETATGAIIGIGDDLRYEVIVGDAVVSFCLR